jgi:hypothetical protein
LFEVLTTSRTLSTHVFHVNWNPIFPRCVPFRFFSVLLHEMTIDEPSNDLDVDTLRNLEEALLNFAGCAIVVSHDRYFLDRIATHILAFEGDSKCFFFPGNYAEYEENRKQRLGDIASIKRIKYAPLVNA